jgi:hypothetical protein
VRRLMTIPGVGPVTATALAALAPPAETFKRGRDFAAWGGLTPLQHSTGGKQKLGATSKMGERTLRRLLILGASGVLRWAARNGAPADSWLARMLACKPPMLVRVALAKDGSRHLGLDGQRRDLPSSGSERVSAHGCGVVGAKEGRRRGMVQRSMRRDQENQCATTRLERVALNWT